MKAVHKKLYRVRQYNHEGQVAASHVVCADTPDEAASLSNEWARVHHPRTVNYGKTRVLAVVSDSILTGEYD